MITMERVEGAVAIDICEGEAVLSSVQRKLKAVRAVDNFTIFRVPAHVRQGNNKHLYEPLMVAIGPYGRREEPSLRAMEEHKWRYVQDFLSRCSTTIEKCIDLIQEVEPLARRCYFERVELSTEKFVEILLLDGCFIVEFLIKSYQEENDSLFDAVCSLPLVCGDLLLLENQIPFFVLEKLYELRTFKIDGTAATPVQGPEISSLRVLLVKFLTNMTIESRKEKVEGNKDLIVSVEAKEFNHLLHCYYTLNFLTTMTIESPEEKVEGNKDLIVSGEAKEFNHLLHCCYPLNVTKPHTDPTGYTNCGTILKWLNPSRVFTSVLSYARSKTCKSNKKRFPGTIPSATELLEAGVKIKKKKKKKKKNQNQNQNHLSSFLDVTFCPRDGVLEIPFLLVYDSTLPLFSNLMAFEQFGGCEPKKAYITSYAAFMDCLVNTPEDDAILRQRGILENNLASDKHLTNFFNQLSEWLVLDFDNHYLAELFRDVRKYCDSNWHKWRAKLVRDYFSNPWAIISLIAALVVLVLTFLQTIYTILSNDKK